MRRFLPLLLCSFFILACSTEPVGSTQWSIVDGERTNMNEQAVVAVLDRAGGLCTGTLIAPRVVLTAKHCVQRSGASGPTSPGNLVVGIGDQVRGLTQTFSVTAVRTTDGPYRDDGSLSGLVGIDIALITLQTEASIEPIPIHRGSAIDRIGMTARAVGFGQTPAGGAGVKYRTMTVVESVNGGVIGTPPTICQGDSGGPLITLEGEVFGVASFGTGACGGGFNGYNRVDTYLEMVDEVLTESGSCTNTGVEECDGQDDDCDDRVDEDCLATGTACSAGEECLSLRCEDTVSGAICTEACDPLRPYTGCPPGLYCARTSGCEGRCEAGVAGMLPNDADCTADTECASLFCSDPGDGRQRCLTPCQGDGGGCFFGEVCAALPGSCGGCVPAGLVAGARALGESCTEAAECGTTLCLEEPGDSYCTRECDDDADCGDAFHCRMSDGAGRCARGPRSGVGDSCIDNLDCAPRLFCATRGSEHWCTSICTDASECPAEFGCVAVGDVSICVADLGTAGAACMADEDCLSSFCQPVGRDGELQCTRACDAANPCASGFACVRDDAGLDSVCVPLTEPPPSSGGCSAGGSTAPATLSLLMLAIFFAGRRRSSRRIPS